MFYLPESTADKITPKVFKRPKELPGWIFGPPRSFEQEGRKPVLPVA